MECKNKKAFNLKAKHLLPDSVWATEIYVNIYWGGLQMNNFEQVYVVGDPHVVVGGGVAPCDLWPTNCIMGSGPITTPLPIPNRQIWLKTLNLQESIPKGCLTTTAVTATRCLSREVSVRRGGLCPGGRLASEQNDWQRPLKTLPSLAVDKYVRKALRGIDGADGVGVFDHDVIQVGQRDHEVFTCRGRSVLPRPLVLREGDLEADWLTRCCGYSVTVL